MALTAAAVMKATIWFWSRWAPGTACAMTPANHPAATAKTGVRMATNLPISEASVGADDGTEDGSVLFMMLLDRSRRCRTRETVQLWPAGSWRAFVAALQAA